MKKILLWGIGGVIGVFLLLAGVGLWAKKNDPQGYEQKQRELTISDSSSNTAETSEAEAGAEADRKALANVEAILRKQGLTLCEVYQWIGDSELKVGRDLEARHGIPAAMKMVDERNVGYKKAWQKYRKQHNLPDSIRTYINVFGVTNCQ